jgi:hypothetical protein
VAFILLDIGSGMEAAPGRLVTPLARRKAGSARRAHHGHGNAKPIARQACAGAAEFRLGRPDLARGFFLRQVRGAFLEQRMTLRDISQHRLVIADRGSAIGGTRFMQRRKVAQDLPAWF